MDRVFLLAFVFMPFLSFAHAQEAAGPDATGSSLSVTEPEPEDSTRHRNAGVLAAGDGDFVLAEHEFRASLAIHFRAETAIAHAYALEQLGRFGEAIAVYTQLLQLSVEERGAESARSSLERYRTRAREQQSTLVVVVQGAESGQIIVDGVVAGRYAEGQPLTVPLDPGEHRVAAVFGARESRALVALSAGERRDLPLRFAPRPAEVAAAAQPDVELGGSSDEELARADARSGTVYWILGGVVVLAAVVIVGLALRPSPTEEDALPVWRALGPPSR